MKNQNETDNVLTMTLHGLGFTPQTGSPLWSLLYSNNETLERHASRPRECKGAPGLCGSCGSRPRECHAVLHDFKKIPASKVLEKWKRYYGKKPFDFASGSCHICHFLIPPLKRLLQVLMLEGLPPEFIHTEVPCAEKILSFGEHNLSHPAGK
jgi:hypothetical protein